MQAVPLDTCTAVLIGENEKLAPQAHAMVRRLINSK
jgi:hypothetical protein